MLLQGLLPYGNGQLLLHILVVFGTWLSARMQTGLPWHLVSSPLNSQGCLVFCSPLTEALELVAGSRPVLQCRAEHFDLNGGFCLVCPGAAMALAEELTGSDAPAGPRWGVLLCTGPVLLAGSLALNHGWPRFRLARIAFG